MKLLFYKIKYKYCQFIFILLLVFNSIMGHSKQTLDTTIIDNSWADTALYRAFATKIVDLVHTKLDASFDYKNSFLIGKVWIKMKPHFYPTDSVILDAKSMDINEVMLVSNQAKTPLSFTYDGLSLRIKLPQNYYQQDTFVIYINYVAKPNSFKGKGSEAISNDKGLYFINPLGTEPEKPTQIWTQGETEANSVWIPTIDKTDQKTTQEFILTYPDKFVSLSNGKLIKQTKNTNGTKTDYWKMNLPHAPYLMFIGIGEYAIIKDNYKGKEVSYYVEKKYADVARKIFGLTPQMMQFYSQILGVEYVWDKYSQIVTRDYVSGAMENTTCTNHQESAQQDARELFDQNHWETVIAHELFHHWFGDLVTAESWSNLTVNESFADYAQTLWLEHKYGKDFGEYENYSGMKNYLSDPDAFNKDLVRFHYHTHEDIFDLVSYQKGGRILNMLRHFLGDQAFFAGLSYYLNQYKFGNANARQLQFSFEKVSGIDLNWFFNQWYFNSGNPKVNLGYNYLKDEQKVQVFINQKQEQLFKLPLDIDIYVDNKYTRYRVWAENRNDTFYFQAINEPNLVNIDADKTTLWIKKEKKSLAENIFLYQHAKNYLDRNEAVEFFVKNINKQEIKDLLISIIKNDSFHAIQLSALKAFDGSNYDSQIAPLLISLAHNTKKHYTVRGLAVKILGNQSTFKNAAFFKNLVYDSSYYVAGLSLAALYKLDSNQGYEIAQNLYLKPAKNKLLSTFVDIFIDNYNELYVDFIISTYKKMGLSEDKYNLTSNIVSLVSKIDDFEKFKAGVNALVDFKNSFPESYQAKLAFYFDFIIYKPLLAAKVKAKQDEYINYLEKVFKK